MVFIFNYRALLITEKYIRNRRAFSFVLLFFFSVVVAAQKNAFVILDVSQRNNEVTSGNLFSAAHALIVAGTPYSISTDVDSAIQNKFILVSSSIESNTFTIAERDSLISFVDKGGILFITQLKDSSLFKLAGVSDYQYSSTHYFFNWTLENLGQAGEFIDDPKEKVIKLADSSFTKSISFRSYTLSSAVSLAKFENDSVAFSKNQYGKGFVYLLGINWEDLVLRNQVSRHFKAARSFSNDFEPGSDVFYLFLRGIYKEHSYFSVYKHTSVQNSNSILVITHDVDATSAIKDIMTDFSSYEYNNNIRATYFITTHYMHDSVAKDFWNGYLDEIISVKNRGHELASHSVSHVPDFDNSSVVKMGSCSGEDENSYRPFFDGTKSNSVTVCGEVEVSKKLLDDNVGSNIKSFRAGYLAYNKYILEALEQTGYKFNSSHSANNVLTAFPFQGHLDLSINSRLSHIYEIPNTISDVFVADRITETNYNEKVDIWIDVQRRYAHNYAPSVLLIHPNRNWKILGQQRFIKSLPPKTAIIPFEEYGNYWKDREGCGIEINQDADSIVNVIVSENKLQLNSMLSFIVNNGQSAKEIHVTDKQGNTIPLLQGKWRKNDVILYSKDFNEKYNQFDFQITENSTEFKLYPNPLSEKAFFEFELFIDANVDLKIYDVAGRLIDNPINEKQELGRHKLEIETKKLGTGIYFYSISFGDQAPKKGKMLILK